MRKDLLIGIVLISMLGGLDAQQPSERLDEASSSTEQLRGIAEFIKKCPEDDQSISEYSMVEGREKPAAFRRRVSPPLNVVWDVEQHPSSVRSPEIGFIEFTTNASCNPPLPTIPHCKQKDELCSTLYRADSNAFKSDSEYCQNLKPNQYRYEFDLGSNGLEFSRALKKPENAGRLEWAPIELERGKDWTDGVAESCAADAVWFGVSTRPTDIPEGFWRMAKNGDAESMRHIATAYDYGQGVHQNYGEAIRWYRVAAYNGNDWSMGRLGSIYDLGLGVPKNKALALGWQLMGADKGNAVAIAFVGQAYSDGLEVPQNFEEAYFWLSLSSSVSLSDFTSANNPDKLFPMVKRVRDEAAARLSSGERSQVQERVEKWIETHPKIH